VICSPDGDSGDIGATLGKIADSTRPDGPT
jgi:hypothetical protein